MIVHPFRSVLLLLLPLALAACGAPGPAAASTASPLGVDLGASGPVSALAPVVSPPAVSRAPAASLHPGMQVAHEGHDDAHGIGTVNSVDPTGHKVNLSHQPIPEIGWPAMQSGRPSICVRSSPAPGSTSPSRKVRAACTRSRPSRPPVAGDEAYPPCSRPRPPPHATERWRARGTGPRTVAAAANGRRSGHAFPGHRFRARYRTGTVRCRRAKRRRHGGQWDGSRPDPALARGRYGYPQSYQPPCRAEFDPLAWHPPTQRDGRRAGSDLPRHCTRRDLYLPLSGPPERHLLVPQPLNVSGADGALRADRHYREAFDRDYIVMLSDWSFEAPETIVSNLKQQSDYYNYRQRTLGTLINDVKEKGLGATVSDRIDWGQMRMSPTDILDVSGATYTYLLNGYGPEANWTALFKLGERVRLRFINGSSMSIFDVSIPGLPLTVVQADGNDIVPVTVDQFRISVAETYDVIVTPKESRAFTIFAQAEDRTGYACGTLAPQAGMAAAIPPFDPRPMRSMADMGMEGMEHGEMPGMTLSPEAKKLEGRPSVDNVAMMPTTHLDRAGEGFRAGRRVLSYADLRALKPGNDPRPPDREITLHLTGNMQRFMWGFDGKKYSEAGPIEFKRGERVRFTLINDTMMEHPIHLHGLWSELENGQEANRPYKHTINVKPAEQLSFLVTADEPGRWAFHCHLLYHMEMGMFREVRVA